MRGANCGGGGGLALGLGVLASGGGPPRAERLGGSGAVAEAGQATRDAIRDGADVIYQGALLGESPGGGPALLGRPDFLIRADLLSGLDGGQRGGRQHYEGGDATLPRT